VKKKKLMMVLISQMCLTGAALAQTAAPPVPTGAKPPPSGTGVQIYGLVTEGVTVVNNQAGGASLHTVGNSPLAQSFLGFRGREDLGDGMAAVFRLETLIAADTGVAGNTVAGTGKFWNRQAFVGLTALDGAVSVTAGRQFAAATDRVVRSLDPYNVGGNLVATTPMALFGVNRYYTATATGTTGTDSRVDNSVKLRVNGPNGFTAAVSGSPSEGEGRNLSLDLAQETKDYTVGTYYTNYRHPNVLANGSVPNNTVYGLGGNVLIGPVRLYLNLLHSSIDSTTIGQAAQVDKLFASGLSWLISPQWVYRLEYTHDQGNNVITGATAAAKHVSTNGAKKTWVTSIDYYFSKRTSVYATLFNNRYTDGYLYEALNTSVRPAGVASSTGYSVGLQTTF